MIDFLSLFAAYDAIAAMPLLIAAASILRFSIAAILRLFTLLRATYTLRYASMRATLMLCQAAVTLMPLPRCQARYFAAAYATCIAIVIIPPARQQVITLILRHTALPLIMPRRCARLPIFFAIAAATFATYAITLIHTMPCCFSPCHAATRC